MIVLVKKMAMTVFSGAMRMKKARRTMLLQNYCGSVKKVRGGGCKFKITWLCARLCACFFTTSVLFHGAWTDVDTCWTDVDTCSITAWHFVDVALSSKPNLPFLCIFSFESTAWLHCCQARDITLIDCMSLCSQFWLAHVISNTWQLQHWTRVIIHVPSIIISPYSIHTDASHLHSSCPID